MADPPSPARRRAGRNSPLEKKVLTMKLKEMEEMEKMARKVNTSVGSLLVSTAPCSLTYRENGVRRGAGRAVHRGRHCEPDVLRGLKANRGRWKHPGPPRAVQRKETGAVLV